MISVRSARGQITGPALAIALAAALTYFAATEVVHGVKWVGHKAKRAAAAIVHVIKKEPHP